LAVQNGIELLSGTALAANGHPGDAYRFAPRTREELLATQHLVANARDVGENEDPQDPVGVTPQDPPHLEAKVRPAIKGWIM